MKSRNFEFCRPRFAKIWNMVTSAQFCFNCEPVFRNCLRQFMDCCSWSSLREADCSKSGTSANEKLCCEAWLLMFSMFWSRRVLRKALF